MNEAAHAGSPGPGGGAMIAMVVTEESIQYALREPTTDVLESMFFIESESAECRIGEPVSGEEGEVLEVEIAFEGDRSGRFAMRLAPDAATAIAADFLGEDSAGLTEVLRSLSRRPS